MKDSLKPVTCENCGTEDGYKLVDREPELVTRHGIAFEVSGLKWYECRNCGDVINTPFVVDSNAALVEQAYRNRRNSLRKEKNLLSPLAIREIRSNLNETQESLSDLLGIGRNGLQKYENDKSCPSKPVDLLLRVLGIYPSFLAILREVSEIPATNVISAKKSFPVMVHMFERRSLARQLGIFQNLVAEPMELQNAIQTFAKAMVYSNLMCMGPSRQILALWAKTPANLESIPSELATTIGGVLTITEGAYAGHVSALSSIANATVASFYPTITEEIDGGFAIDHENYPEEGSLFSKLKSLHVSQLEGTNGLQ